MFQLHRLSILNLTKNSRKDWKGLTVCFHKMKVFVFFTFKVRQHCHPALGRKIPEKYWKSLSVCFHQVKVLVFLLRMSPKFPSRTWKESSRRGCKSLTICFNGVEAFGFLLKMLPGFPSRPWKDSSRSGCHGLIVLFTRSQPVLFCV